MLRSEAVAQPQVAILVEQGCTTGVALKKERDQLARRLSVETAAAAEELSRSSTILRSAGRFAILSGEYRAAKRLYRSVAKDGGYNRDHAADDLSKLAEWKRKEERFLSSKPTRTVFGLHFDGLDTDFDRFTRLMQFYRRIDKELSGVALRDVRKFLKTAEIDLLHAIPNFELSDLGLTHRKLGADLEQWRAELEKADKGCKEIEELSRCIKDTRKILPDNLDEIAELVEAYVEQREEIENHPLKVVLGQRFAGIEMEVEAIANEIAAAELVATSDKWSGDLLNLLSSGRVNEALDAVGGFRRAFEAAERALNDLLDLTGVNRENLPQSGLFEAIAEWLEGAANDREGLNLHAAVFAALRDIDALGFAGYVRDLQSSGVGLEGLADKLEAMIVRALAKSVYGEHGDRLSRFTGDRIENLRDQLTTLDKRFIEMSRAELRASLIANSRPPSGRGTGRKSEWTEMALLQNEINKQKRHYPVRDVTRRAGRALLELKPCWMMSPLAIAQYLDLDAMKFDLCIIDEASQMPPENAVGALLRAKQTMIVGDTQQLPPTSFFRKLIADDDADEDENVLDESILEMANATFRPVRRLRWHYRSRHSGLIRFSNRMVYDDDLIVFPSASEDRGDMGVSLVQVDGLYMAGTNAVEAQTIVEAAIRFMHDEPLRSLGIVTLNQKQRDLIQEQMQYALNDDAEASAYVEHWATNRDGLESFFVKNLENVQGDERDVIFIGTVYGPESPGARVHQRFGPINGVAGKRRLNVLFSRAKQKIVTFSSMTAADILADGQRNPGAYMLRRWLEYAASGVLDSGTITIRDPDSDFEEYVAQQIKAMGCEVEHQVGVRGYFIDIGVRHPRWPHGFLLGVECDGASYHSAKSARDRDRLRQQVLEGLGWHFHRVWSTDWFNDPRVEAEKLRRRIEARLEDALASAPVVVGPIADEGSAEEHRPTSDHAPPDEETPSIADDLFSYPEADRASEEQADEPMAPDPSPSWDVDVGDTVRVQYLDGDRATLLVTLSKDRNDPSIGIVHVSEPLGEALLGAEAGEEVEVLVGPRLRLARIEEVKKAATV